MVISKIWLIFILLFFIICLAGHAEKIETYPAPCAKFNKGSNLYTVQIKQGAVIKNSYVYVSNAINKCGPGKEWMDQQGKSFHYCIFSFSGKVSISIIKLNSKAIHAVIRPGRAGIAPVTTTNVLGGKKVSFVITKSGKLSVEFDDDPANRQVLMLFANGLENIKDVPATSAINVFKATDANVNVPSDKNILYFSPGVYHIGYFQVPDNVKQVYIAGGAYIRGYFFASRYKAGPLKINGRGIISNDIFPFHYPERTENFVQAANWYKSIKINGGANHIIEGITLVDGSSNYILLNADNCLVTNVNINGFRWNNDAVTMAGNYNSIQNCFIRVNEDAIILSGNNTTVTNCVFWQLANGGIFALGYRPHTISGVNLIAHCDVIHSEYKPHASVAGFFTATNQAAPLPGTDPVVENFSIDDIKFDTGNPRLADIRMTHGEVRQPNRFKNFVFKNINIPFATNSNSIIMLNGFDNYHRVTGFRFYNLKIAHKLINDEAANQLDLVNLDSFSERPQFITGNN